MKHRIAILIAVILIVPGCSQAQPRVDAPQATKQATPQTGQQTAGQGAVNVAAAAGDAQAGIGDKPNRHAPADTDANDDGASLEGEIKDAKGDTVMSFKAKGNLPRTLNMALDMTIENTADATVSGTTKDTAQAQEQAPKQDVAQDVKADQDATAKTDTDADLTVTP